MPKVLIVYDGTHFMNGINDKVLEDINVVLEKGLMKVQFSNSF